MSIIDSAVASGDIVNLARTNPLHIAGGLDVPTTDASGGIESKFGQMLLGALGSVNDSQLKAMGLSQQMVTDPTNVNVEDVTIALADANLALSMTKAIVDRALAAYREIINIR
jgi:flagellar hook-basal body complex protein FliE